MDKAKMASLAGMALVSIVSLDRCRYSGKTISSLKLFS